jgi:hypothetical protein
MGNHNGWDNHNFWEDNREDNREDTCNAEAYDYGAQQGIATQRKALAATLTRLRATVTGGEAIAALDAVAKAHEFRSETATTVTYKA